jgi:DNA-binding transcriptional LysR family regulator
MAGLLGLQGPHFALSILDRKSGKMRIWMCMNAQDGSWEALHLILAITRGGGLAGAGRLLGLHHATVLRRLNALEKRAGVALFERRLTGYVPTKDGEEMARIAERLEEDVLEAHRKLAGKDLRLSGTIRLATADYVVGAFLAPALAAFGARHPNIEIEIAISAQLASLTRRDADIALRPTDDPPGELVGVRLRGLEFGVYGARRPGAGKARSADLDAMAWIASDDLLARSAASRWRQRRFPNVRVRTRLDSMVGIFEAVKAGLGVAFLPCFMADAQPALARYPTPGDRFEIGLWLLTHPDLKNMHRIRALFQIFTQTLASPPAPPAGRVSR